MIQRDGTSLTIFAEGRIDTNAAPHFAAEMEKALPGVTDLTVDCAKLEYISSSGLRALMLAVKTMAAQGDMRIINMNEDIYDILEATGFTGVCDVETNY